MPSQDPGEILNLKFVYFLNCNVVDASALYVRWSKLIVSLLIHTYREDHKVVAFFAKKTLF
jgi:hypothetical protein